MFDRDLKLTSWSTRFVKFFDLPDDMVFVGQTYAALLRYVAMAGACNAEYLEN